MSKDAYYFKHDSNASNDPKMVTMLMRHGMVGYGRFWRLIEILREQRDYRLPRSSITFSAVAKAWICTTGEATDFLKSLEVDYELIHSDENFIWSDSLCRRMGALEAIRSSRSASARKAAKKRWNASGNRTDASRIQSDASRNASVTEKNASGIENDANVLDLEDLEEHSSDRIETDASRMPPAAVSTPEGSNGEAALNTHFVAILRIRLAGAAITLPPEELQTAADRLSAMGAADDEYVSYAIDRCKKADKKEARSTWFLKGIYEYGWVAKWKSEQPKKKLTEPKLSLPPVLEDMKAERERQEADPVLMQKTALDLAHTHQLLHSPLTEADRQALADAGEEVPAPLISEPVFEEEPAFEEDFPWQPEEDTFPEDIAGESDKSDSAAEGGK